MFSRDALIRLDWRLSVGRYLSSDLTTRVRACLADIPITYAAKLSLAIDLPSDTQAMRSQHSRWGAGAVELVVPFGIPLLKRCMKGDWHSLDMLQMLLCPPMSIIYLLASVISAFSFLLIPKHSHWFPWVCIWFGMWVLHTIYYVSIIATDEEGTFHWRECISLAAFMITRALAMLGGVMLAFDLRSGDRWKPMGHGRDKSAD